VTTKLIVWDFDGTLVDSRPQILAGMDHALGILNLGDEVRAEWLKYVGLPVEDGIAKTFGPLGLTLEEVLPVYRSFDWMAHEHLLHPFPGMSALLSELLEAGVKMAIATSKRSLPLARQLKQFGWEHFFSPLVTPDEVQHGKPHQESLELIQKMLNLASEEMLMVGDTPFDLEMAQRAGVPSVAVGHGFYDRDSLLAWNPIGFAPDVPALREILLAKVHA
jgi:phosphoglycolate phosphatase